MWCHDDLIDVVTGAGAAIDVIIVPKVKAPRDVWFVDTLLSQLEAKLGLEPGRIGLEILIEEDRGAGPRRGDRRLLGPSRGTHPRRSATSPPARASEPVTSAVRRQHYPGDMWHYARNRTIVAARANGLDAIDGPNANFRDLDDYRTDATWAATLGAVGKWAIHPSQIAIANEVFSPTADEIAHAERVIAAVREAEASGAGAASVDGQMIDAATARIFETVLDRATRAGSASEPIRLGTPRSTADAASMKARSSRRRSSPAGWNATSVVPGSAAAARRSRQCDAVPLRLTSTAIGPVITVRSCRLSSVR